MQLLIVHDDAEVGGQLAGMVADYTEHQCERVDSDAAALAWAEKHAHCELLLAQLEGPGVDGLTLGGSLSEIFPGLQTMFLPAYPAAEQRLEIAKTKVFPEPIDGDRLLEAIETAAAASAGAPDLFHVLDVLQMCCLSKRSGAVQIVNERQNGIVYLRDGKIVHAESAVLRGTEALLEIAGWDEIEFAYDFSIRAPETISMPWDEALIEAVVRHKKSKPAEIPSPKVEPTSESESAPPPKPARRGFFASLRKSGGVLLPFRGSAGCQPAVAGNIW
jgi:CheY-like chemotaxis protein